MDFLPSEVFPDMGAYGGRSAIWLRVESFSRQSDISEFHGLTLGLSLVLKIVHEYLDRLPYIDYPVEVLCLPLGFHQR